MAPVGLNTRETVWLFKRSHGRDDMSVEAIILEAWGQGFTVGSLVILMLIVLCNIRRRVLLHKLILLEMFLALFHGTFIFLEDPTYGWYLSGTATLLFISYQVHNFVAYLKIKSFVPTWGRWTYLLTLLAVQPYWIVETWDNYLYFNRNNDLNLYTRPWEALARDPWWIFTTVFLFYKIKSGYEFTVLNLFRTSPRFAVMATCMILSIAFLLADVIVTAASLTTDAGINPYWRLTLVFKCASDTIFLDDFKSVLDGIVNKRFQRFRSDGEAGNGTASDNGRSRKKSYGGHEHRSTSRPSFAIIPWKKSKQEQPISEHVEMADHHSTDGSSCDKILPTELPVFPDATITVERKIVSEDWKESGAEDRPAYRCSVSAMNQN